MPLLCDRPTVERERHRDAERESKRVRERESERVSEREERQREIVAFHRHVTSQAKLRILSNLKIRGKKEVKKSYQDRKWFSRKF